VNVAAAERERAFGEFVAGRYTSLVRTAFLLTGDRGHAEDLVQVSLLRTFHAWGRLHAPESAEAYARTTMIRLASRWRSRRWTDEVASADVPDRDTPDHAEHVDEAVRVRAALQALPWSQRAVLVLRYYDDLPESEVAAILSCRVGTVKSRASRGLAALRDADLLGSTSDVGEVHGDR
jgi:RNA polymerase sigma-70 factor (sigma-E family)